MVSGISILILTFCAATAVSAAYQIAPLRPGFITKYTINCSYKRPKVEVVGSFDLFLRSSDEEGRYGAIIRNVNLNASLTRKANKFDDPARWLKYRWSDRRFNLIFDDKGRASTNYPGDYEDYFRIALAEFWEMIGYDRQLPDELLANKTEYERMVMSSLDGNTRECVGKFKATPGVTSYEVDMTVNMTDCQKDSELTSIGGRHSADYNLQMKQSLQKDDFTLKWRTIAFQTFDRRHKKETSGLVVINFDSFLDEKEHAQVFQPRASLLTDNVVDMTEIFPLKPDYDTKYRVEAYIKDFSNTFHPHFDLYVRQAPNNYYVFGSVVNVTFPTFYGSTHMRRLFKDAVERVFLLGIDDQSRPVFRHVDEGGPDRHIGNRDFYNDVLKYDRDSVRRVCPTGVKPFETEVEFESHFFGEDCKAKHEIKDMGEYYETTKIIDTAPTCGLGSEGKIFGLLGKRRSADDSLRWVVQQTLFKSDMTLRSLMTEFEWKGLSSRIEFIKARIVITFDDYVLQSDNNESVFNVYGQVVDETFFN